MTSIEEQLKQQVIIRADKEGLSERAKLILIWILEETHGREGRMPKSELRQELERLGKTVTEQKD